MADKAGRYTIDGQKDRQTDRQTANQNFITIKWKGLENDLKAFSVLAVPNHAVATA